MQPLKVGVIGCGNISDVYLRNCRSSPLLEVVACSDLLPERAAAKAAAHDIPKSCPVSDLLADPQIELVLNLTIPRAHAEVSLAALRAGKHVYSEKPLAATRALGRDILQEAARRGLRVGCAPDTFLGGGLQTCRQLLDGGAIGEPVGATAFMLCHGHEAWHPDPEFYYKPGGGPLMDMGPYYLTALVSLLGPVARVTGIAGTTFPQRVITSEARRGQVIQVETPTHIAGVLQFAAGPIATLVTSFDVWVSTTPGIEIYGTEGTLVLTDPNGFGGEAKVWRRNTGQWSQVPATHGFTYNARGIGVLDMAAGIRAGRPHRASGDLAYHVLDVMEGILDASFTGSHYSVPSRCDRPAPLAPDLETTGAWD
ncbi:MAG: Gfo/Idh/MocA family protein [Chthonomonadales bacterium]